MPVARQHIVNAIDKVGAWNCLALTLTESWGRGSVLLPGGLGTGSYNTQLPMSTMRSVSSAMGMNSGDTRARPGGLPADPPPRHR